MRIYAEGGGEGPLLDTLFRKAWRDFFESAGLSGRMPRVIRGKGRLRTFDLFRTAVAQGAPGTLPLLLVDSEGPIQAGHTAWQHLAARDHWILPLDASESQAFLMVEIMETWLIADRVALRGFFGAQFNESAIPKWPSLESVPKARILQALESATANCRLKYAKGRTSFELLSKVNALEVERRCSHAQRLLDFLRTSDDEG